MQLSDLITPIESLSDEELRARLLDLRRRRETDRPKAVKAIKKEDKKEGRKKVTAAERLLAELTPEQLAILMVQIGEGK